MPLSQKRALAPMSPELCLSLGSEGIMGYIGAMAKKLEATI